MRKKLREIWLAWTAPQIATGSPTAQIQPQLLASTLLVLFLVSIAYSLGSSLLNRAEFNSQKILPLGITLGGTFLAYLMSRRRMVKWAPHLFSLTFTVGTTILLIQAGRYTAIPLFLILPTLFLNVFVSLTTCILFTLFNFLILIGLLVWDVAIRQAMLTSDNFLIFPLVVGIGLLLTHYRNSIEENRQAELKASQVRLRSIFDTANDWIFMLDHQGCFSFINDQMSIDTGYVVDEVLGHSFNEFLTGEGAEKIADAFSRIARGESIDVFTTVVNLRNGRHFWIEVRGRAIYDAQGKLEQTMHIARDITERMAIAKAEQEQRERAEAMSDTAAIFSSTLALDEVLDHVLGNIHRVLPYDAADILLVRDGKTYTAGQKGYDKFDAVDIMERVEFVISETETLNYLMETGQPLAVADTREFPGWVLIPGLDWVRSVAGAPIVYANNCLGFLHVASAKPNAYTTKHAASLRAFANHVANAIHNARLYEAEQHRRHLAETLRQTTAVLNSTLALDTVLSRILEQLSYSISFDSASLQKRDGDQLIICAARGFDHPDKLIGLAIPVGTDSPNSFVFATQKPVSFADIPAKFHHFQEKADLYQSGKIRSWLAVPLMFDDNIIGLVTLDRHEVRPFTTEEVEVATAFAQHAAIAMHNADLYEQLARANERLETAVAHRTAELQETTRQVTAILQNSPDAILLLDHTLRPRLFNPAYTDMFGYTTLETCDQFPMCLVIPGDKDRFAKALQIVLNEKQPMRLDFTAQRKNGTQFDADIALAPIQQPEDAINLLCSIRDITALKEIERVKDDFVSNVSHELRTPIASLKLYHDLLGLNPVKSQDYIERIGREVIRLNTIVESLLQLSRLDQERIEWKLNLIDLNELVQEYATDRQPLAASRNIELIPRLKPNLSPILGDKNLLGQVLSILLTNALNYTPVGGQIVLKTSGRYQDQQHWISFEISDTGQGIRQEELPHILKRFYRGHAGRTSGEPGTGLGLAIADEIVRRHRGKISVDSGGEGQGSTFTVWLPAAQPTVAADGDESQRTANF